MLLAAAGLETGNGTGHLTHVSTSIPLVCALGAEGSLVSCLGGGCSCAPGTGNCQMDHGQQTF